MTAADWSDGSALALALYLDGTDHPDRAADGMPLLDDDFLVLVNAWWEPLEFTLPATRAASAWHAELDTYDPARPAATAVFRAGGQLTVGPRSIVVLRGPLHADGGSA
jgi:isoamylase